MKVLNIALVLVIGLFVSACSKTEQDDGEHFASSQQKALEKAQAVEGTILDAEKKKREQTMMDEQAPMDAAGGAEQPAETDTSNTP